MRSGSRLPAPEVTKWMIDRYPADIRGWIDAKGGLENMPTPRLLDAAGERAMGDWLSEMRRLIDPEARQWALVFIPS
jgi:hypothetical protein